VQVKRAGDSQCKRANESEFKARSPHNSLRLDKSVEEPGGKSGETTGEVDDEPQQWGGGSLEEGGEDGGAGGADGALVVRRASAHTGVVLSAPLACEHVRSQNALIKSRISQTFCFPRKTLAVV